MILLNSGRYYLKTLKMKIKSNRCWSESSRFCRLVCSVSIRSVGVAREQHLEREPRTAWENLSQLPTEIRDAGQQSDLTSDIMGNVLSSSFCTFKACSERPSPSRSHMLVCFMNFPLIHSKSQCCFWPNLPLKFSHSITIEHRGRLESVTPMFDSAQLAFNSACESLQDNTDALLVMIQPIWTPAVLCSALVHMMKTFVFSPCAVWT